MFNPQPTTPSQPPNSQAPGYPLPKLKPAKFGSWTAYEWILAASVALLLAAEIGPMCFGIGGKPLHYVFWSLIAYGNFVSACLLATYIAYIVMLPIHKTELVSVTLVGLVIEVLLYSCVSAKPVAYFALLNCGVGFGLASMTAMIYRISRNYSEKALAIKLLACTVALPTGLLVEIFFQDTCLQICRALGFETNLSQVCDALAFTIDGFLGFQISFLLGKLGLCCEFSYVFFNYIYNWLPLWMVLAQVIVLHHWKGRICQPLLMYAAQALFGKLLYFFFPIVGVAVLCGSVFPWQTPPHIADPMAVLNAPLELPRNGMPSLHMGWVLAAYWSVCYIKPLYKYIGGLLVLLTAISTFPVGHHYLLDLVIAVPFSLGCYALSLGRCTNRKKMQIICIIAGTVFTMGWLSIIKYAPLLVLNHNLVTVWGLALTVAACLLLKHYLGWPELDEQASMANEPTSATSQATKNNHEPEACAGEVNG